MMYAHKLALAVKVNGKVLRENAGEVFLPFGSEYSLMLKNMSAQKALVKVEIDNRNAVAGGLILNGGEKIDLERFVDNINQGRKFKFIEKTNEISEYRGDFIEDGLIRVSWQFEEPYTAPLGIWYVRNCGHWHSGPCTPFHTHTYRVGGQSISGNSILSNANVTAAYNCNVTNTTGVPMAAPSMDGITVDGSRSHQKFTYGHIGSLETTVHTAVFHLRGTNKSTPIEKPITTRETVQCKTCGKNWGPRFEFCGGCGTALRS